MNDFEKFHLSRKPYGRSAMDDYLRKTTDLMSPYVLEERKLNVQPLDIVSRLLYERIVWLGTEVNDESANLIISQLLYLDSMDQSQPITININSPGGSCSSGLGIYDTMQNLESKTHSVGIGLCASFGAVILCAADHRSALHHSSIMIHQPRIIGHGITGTGTDIEIEALEMQKTKKLLTEILAKHSKVSYDVIHDLCERDKWLTAEEARDELGLIDDVIYNKDRGDKRWKKEEGI